MDLNLISAPSPHIHSTVTSRRLMMDVIVALVPACIAACVLFGTKALAVLVVCTVSAVLAEVIFNLVTDQPQSVGDLSAVVTGLLLALNLSTNVPLWQCAVGAVFSADGCAAQDRLRSAEREQSSLNKRSRRVLLPLPRRRKLHLACGDFLLHK